MSRLWRLVLDFLRAFLAGFVSARELRQGDVNRGAEEQRRHQAEEDERAAARARVLAQEIRELEDEELRRRGGRWSDT